MRGPGHGAGSLRTGQPRHGGAGATQVVVGKAQSENNKHTVFYVLRYGEIIPPSFLTVF